MMEKSVNIICIQPIFVSNKKSIKVDLIDVKGNDFRRYWTDVSAIHAHNINQNACSYITGMTSKKNLGRLYVFNDCIEDEFNEHEIDSEVQYKTIYEHKLFFDNSNKLFFIIHSVTILIDDNLLSPKMLSELSKNIRTKIVFDNNLEKQIRAISVIDFEHYAIKLVSELLGINEQDNLSIMPNTGHIVAMLSSDDIELTDENDYKISLHEMDIHDRVIDTYTNETVRSIGWRISTLIHKDVKQSYEFIPALINIQNIYFKINKIFKPYISELHDSITHNGKVSSLSVNLLKFDNLLIDFHNMMYQKTNFINSQEPIKIDYYNSIEEYWYVSSDFENISKTLDVYQSTISRKVESVNSASQDNQNAILFVLTVIQVLALVGVFTDYFGFFELSKVTPGNNIEEAYFFISSFMRDWVPYIAIFVLLLSFGLIINAFHKWISNRKFVANIFKSKNR